MDPPSDIERHRGYLRAIARLQLAARPWLAAKLDASDLVQQTLLKAHAAKDQYRGKTEGELAAWLRQILNRTLANELRGYGQAKRDAGLEADLDASSMRLDAWLAADQTSPSGRADDRERAGRLAEALLALPEEHRTAVLMKHCEGLRLEEIATRTNRTPAAVAGLLRRGLARLRILLDGEPTT